MNWKTIERNPSMWASLLLYLRAVHGPFFYVCGVTYCAILLVRVAAHLFS